MPKQFAGYGLSETVLQVAYVLSAISIAVVVGGFLTAPLIKRFGPRTVISAGAATPVDGSEIGPIDGRATTCIHSG